MKAKLLTVICSVMLTGFPAAAQFYSLGSEPATVRWNYVETPAYRIIYPEGLDSLASVYAIRLEQAAYVAGNTAGFRPNEAYGSRMPVVLHAHTAYSNGMVGWTPRRMELMTMPDPYAPDPTPWETQLAVHESRHAAQMQYTVSRPFRGWRIISGELAAGALAAIYCGPAFFEGDAVVAETALTPSGRGRTADFLEYYRTSFANGEFRNYWQWRYGSQRHYTPDYYRAGYITAAGIRTLWDSPDFTARYFRRLPEHGGVVFNNFGKTLKEVSGKKFRAAFREICDSLSAFWAADDSLRAPFMSSSEITKAGRRYTELNGLVLTDRGISAVRSGITIPNQLVSIDCSGNVAVRGNFSSSYTGLEYSRVTGRLYWSEYAPDPRWEMRSFSNIRYIGTDGRRHTLTGGRRFFHPAASANSARIAVSEYPVEGGSATVVLDACDGHEIQVFRAPEGMQVIEPVWVGDELYTTALTDGGYGIYRARDFSCLLGPQPVKIKQPWSFGDTLMFTADLTGVNELYSLDPSDGSLTRLTSTRSGAADFTLNQAADTLYYTVLSPDGRTIHATPVDSLAAMPADFSRLPHYPFAEELSEGEPIKFQEADPDSEISEPRRYSRLSHLFRFHSWMPLYVDYDAVSSLSMSSLTTAASLGATAFFQNDLGNFMGSVAYKAGYGNGSGWRHSGHLNINWSGWYPVIEAKLHFNEREALNYRETEDDKGNKGLGYSPSGIPLLSADLNVYVPLSFSKGGWLSGIIPEVSISATNDRYWRTDGSSGSMSRATARLRGYMMESTPASRIYPRWGIGAELGINGRPELAELLCPTFYSYLYGYVPGLWQTQGTRITAVYERLVATGAYCEPYMVTVPRGFSSTSSSALSAYPDRIKLTADYAMPVLPLDWAGLGPVAYVKNFELTLHGDLSLAGFGAAFNGPLRTLFSAGADFSVRLGNLLWVPYDTRIGISYSYKGGNLFATLQQLGYEHSRHSISLIFSVDL